MLCRPLDSHGGGAGEGGDLRATQRVKSDLLRMLRDERMKTCWSQVAAHLAGRFLSALGKATWNGGRACPRRKREGCPAVKEASFASGRKTEL